MFALNLPPADLKIIEKQGKKQVFDPLRKRYVALTPEEWVRQHFCRFLIDERHYPAHLMANEHCISLNGLKRRCDTVVFDTSLQARVIVEYKAPEVELTQAVFEQIVRYNWVLRADYLIVSNGLNHYCCQCDYRQNTCRFLPDIPDYRQI